MVDSFAFGWYTPWFVTHILELLLINGTHPPWDTSLTVPTHHETLD